MKHFCIAICLIFFASYSQSGVIYTEPVDGELDAFCAELLLKILNYGDETYELKHSAEISSQTRDIASLEKKLIDVIWIATSEDYEARIKPIRIPIYKGLLGYRLFVIPRSKQAIFDEIKTLQALKKITIGQGLGWIDTDILRANGFTVLGALNHHQLYTMLARDRFDALLRGLHEPWEEIKSFNDEGIVVENNILVSYPLPMYFFVNNDNEKLADLIFSNFNKMINDGSFDDMFFSDEKIQNAINKASVSTRKFYTLTNPFLPSKTPLNIKKYWYDVNMGNK